MPLEPGQLELLGAQLTANDRLHVQFRYRVAATVSFAELSADGRVADDYRGTLELSFRGADEPVRVTLRTTGPLGDERPEIERWRTRSVLRVAAIFGQMSTSGALNATDDGIWSYDAFRTFLATVGFHFDGEPGEYSERGVLELKTQRIVVDLVHPRDAPPRASDVNRWLERVTPDHDLVYYNGHAFEGSLEALRRLRRSWSERYVLLYLDSCYSQRDYGAALRGALAEASVTRATVDVLVNHRLTITASVEGFIALFGHLLDALATVDGEAPPWRIFLDEAQQGADARAMRRRTLWPATPIPTPKSSGCCACASPDERSLTVS